MDVVVRPRGGYRQSREEHMDGRGGGQKIRKRWDLDQSYGASRADSAASRGHMRRKEVAFGARRRVEGVNVSERTYRSKDIGRKVRERHGGTRIHEEAQNVKTERGMAGQDPRQTDRGSSNKGKR